MKASTAIKILLGTVVAVTVFHLCILFKIIPYDITWGGRLTNDKEMYVFESFSIGINLIFGLVLLIKGNYIKPFLSSKVVDITLWVFLILFALNTVGNLLAKTNFERAFTVLTLLNAVLIWLVLRKKKV